MKRPHPHFDDGGNFDWHTSLEEALAAARSDARLVLIEYGREQCSQCRALVQNTLKLPEIAPLLAEHFVLLAADCDNADEDVEEIALKLEEAMELPFVLLLDSNGQFLGGVSGAVEGVQLERTLERLVEAHRQPAKAPDAGDDALDAEAAQEA